MFTRIGLLSTRKNGDFGAFSVKGESSCAALIFKVESHISERCSYYIRVQTKSFTVQSENSLKCQSAEIQPVPGSKIVGSAKLRKREHENKTEGNWEQEWRRSLSLLPFFFPPPSPFPRSRADVFACLSLTRHHYNLRAWNKLWPVKKIRAFFIKLLNSIIKRFFILTPGHSLSSCSTGTRWRPNSPGLSVPALFHGIPASRSLCSLGLPPLLVDVNAKQGFITKNMTTSKMINESMLKNSSKVIFWLAIWCVSVQWIDGMTEI